MPSFGRASDRRVFVDPDLLLDDEVGVPAGTWNDVFGIEPRRLIEDRRGVDVSASAVIGT